ncbi:MAG: alginate export family protein, partial [Myxococcota bacterium]
TGYTFRALPTQPRLGLRANVTSGDRNPSSPKLETFNPLFPRGSYFGEASLIGPQNHMDLHPMLELHVLDTVQVTLAWDFFWRTNADDAIYRVSGTPLVSGAESGERYVGNQGSLAIAWQPVRHVELVAAYEHFFAGPFLRDAGLRDVNFVAAWLSFRI